MCACQVESCESVCACACVCLAGLVCECGSRRFFFVFFFSLPHLSAALQELRRRTRRPQSNGFRVFPLVSRAQRVRCTSPPIKPSQQIKKETTKWILSLTVLFIFFVRGKVEAGSSRTNPNKPANKPRANTLRSFE